MHKVTRLAIDNFTVFKDAVFDFAPGVNTLIGANGTGKSHVLKLIYTLAAEQHAKTVAFFALARDAKGGVVVERGGAFTDLQHNAILEALGELHDRELASLAE